MFALNFIRKYTLLKEEEEREDGFQSSFEWVTIFLAFERLIDATSQGNARQHQRRRRLGLKKKTFLGLMKKAA